MLLAMSHDKSAETFAIVAVPQAHAEQVNTFASALLAEQTPDVEGYVALVKGVSAVGASVGSNIGKVAGAVTASVCSTTRSHKDFECDDTD